MRHAWLGWGLALVLWTSPARAQPAAPALVATTKVSLPLAKLASSADALRLSTRASETLAFAARADQVLTSAALELPLSAPTGVQGLRKLVVQLNGEELAAYTLEQLRKANKVRLPIEPTLLGSNNLLSFRFLTDKDPRGCGRVPPGTWSELATGSLALGSVALPLPSDLAVLPLPFLDPQFDREHTLHFVLGGALQSSELQAANLVAAWFSLRGSTRLAFETHLDTLPATDAVVLIDDVKTAAALKLSAPLGEDGLPLQSAIELRAHPAHPERKLLVLWGLGSDGLSAPVRRLLRQGDGLHGAQVAVQREPELPGLLPFEVPRWVKSSEITLGKLPEKPVLRAQGGAAETLRLPFRIAPDSFGWPSDYVQLVLGYQQAYSSATGPAHIHVALNGSSVGVLPRSRKARSSLRVPRSLLRGFNELLVQISYPDRVLPRGEQCDTGSDAKAWVELSPDSQLRLGDTRHFAVLPELGSFLYDGFPFTDHGDLRETVLVLPQRPEPAELSSMFGAVAHFANITGATPSALSVVLGTPSNQQLANRDTLLIAGLGRHPLLERWRDALPLRASSDGAVAQYPSDATWWRRWLSVRLGSGELERAQLALDDGSFAAVMGVAAPWARERSLIVMTASEPAHMPRLSTLMDRSEAVRQRNDLLVVTEARRGLFQLGIERSRGELPDLLSLRFWLAHYWLALFPAVVLAALLFALAARGSLSRIAHRRLHQVDG